LVRASNLGSDHRSAPEVAPFYHQPPVQFPPYSKIKVQPSKISAAAGSTSTTTAAVRIQDAVAGCLRWTSALGGGGCEAALDLRAIAGAPTVALAIVPVVTSTTTTTTTAAAGGGGGGGGGVPCFFLGMGTPAGTPPESSWSQVRSSTPEYAVLLENLYYDGESLQERGDLSGAAALYERLLSLEQPQRESEWGVRALHQLVIISVFERKDYSRAQALHERLLCYFHTAVPRTLVEFVISQLLDSLASETYVPASVLERLLQATIDALDAAGVSLNNRLRFRTVVRLGQLYLDTGALWRLSTLLRRLYRHAGIRLGADPALDPKSASLSGQVSAPRQPGEQLLIGALSGSQLLELFALDMQLQLVLWGKLASVPFQFPQAMEYRLRHTAQDTSPAASIGRRNRDFVATMPPDSSAVPRTVGVALSPPGRPGVPIAADDGFYASRLWRLYQEAMRLKSVLKGVLVSPRTLAIIRTCGGKLYLAQGCVTEAAREFYEAFRHYEEVGAPERFAVLRYLVLANLLSGNTVDLFTAPELQTYGSEPHMRALGDMIHAYEKDDLVLFESSLEKDRAMIEDTFLRPFTETLSSRLWQRAVLRAVHPYRAITLASLAKRLGVTREGDSIAQVEHAVVQLISDGRLIGRIDQTQDVLLVSWRQRTTGLLSTDSPATGTETEFGSSATSGVPAWDDSFVNPTRYSESSYPVSVADYRQNRDTDLDADRVDILLTTWSQRLKRVREQFAQLGADIPRVAS